VDVQVSGCCIMGAGVGLTYIKHTLCPQSFISGTSRGLWCH
jgi:hypothetical protein